MNKTQLSEKVQAVLGDYDLPGANVLIFKNENETGASVGKLSSTEGDYRLDTLFRIGCLVKVLTAMQVMILVDDQMLDLDVPVVAYSDKLKALNFDALNHITARHLLNHTSGLVSNFQLASGRLDAHNLLQALSERQESELFLFPAGAYCSYSTVGYVILSFLLEEILGVSWVEHLSDKLFLPLGITALQTPRLDEQSAAPFGNAINKSYDGPYLDYLPDSITAGDGGSLTLSAGDLMKIAKLHLHAGKTESGQQLISAAGIRLMQECLAAPSGPWPGLKGLGFGWLAYEDGSFGFSGDGVRHHVLLRILPEQDVALVVCANYHSASLLFNELWQFAAEDCLRPQQPNTLEHFENTELDLSAGFTACYGDSIRTLEIVWEGETGKISTKTNNPQMYGQAQTVELMHVQGTQFVAPELGNFTNIWLVQSTSSPNRKYLWTGVGMLPLMYSS